MHGSVSIDKLLASPHYGERYGRHWLDVARYADSGGFEYDVHRPNAWRYRDYVISSFNDDKPYNVVPDRADCRRRDGRQDAKTASSPPDFCAPGRACCSAKKTIRSAATTTSTRFSGRSARARSGLTVNCARCHNHKFDPIPQKDYYAIEGVDLRIRRDRGAAGAARRGRGLSGEERRDQRQDRGAAEAGRRDRKAASRTPGARTDQARSSPMHIYQAAAKPEAERTAGEKLLATQVFEAVNVAGGQIDKVLPPGRARQEAGPRRADGGARERAAHAAADGGDRHRRRLPVLAARRGRRRHQLPEVPDSAAVPRQLPPQGSGTVRSSTVVLPHSRRRREPRPADEAGLHRGRHATAIRRPRFRGPTVEPPAAVWRWLSGLARRRTR